MENTQKLSKMEQNLQKLTDAAAEKNFSIYLWLLGLTPAIAIVFGVADAYYKLYWLLSGLVGICALYLAGLLKVKFAQKNIKSPVSWLWWW